MSEWQPIETAPKDGTLCALRFRDGLGYYESMKAHFFHDDGHWYAVYPPTQVAVKPTHWLQLTEPPK